MKFVISAVTGLFILACGGTVQAAPEIRAVLTAVPGSYSGTCPVKITFNGSITASAPGRVQYKFIRSDGAVAPVRTLIFAEAGSKPVLTTWTLGGPGLPEYEGWQAIQVVYPRQTRSDKAEFRIRCAGAEAGKKPDLVVTDIGVDESCNVKVKVRNNGPGKVPDEVWTDHKPESSSVNISRNGQGWGGITIWRLDPGKALQNPGGTAVYTSKLKISGQAVVKAEIDHTGQVDESSEANNSKTEKLLCREETSDDTASRHEDCLSFNPASATVKQISGDWKIVDGSHWMFSFGAKKGEADKALAVIKKYGLNRSCFVGRPDPSFTYLLVNGSSPSGAMSGEDCVSFNPASATVKQISGDWKIVDGSHWMFSFGVKKGEADKALAVIKKYGFTRSCFVGRPDPSFKYLRK